MRIIAKVMFMKCWHYSTNTRLYSSVFSGKSFFADIIVQHSISPKGHNHLVNIFVPLRLRGQDVFINLSRLASPVGYLVGCGVYILKAMSFVKQK